MIDWILDDSFGLLYAFSNCEFDKVFRQPLISFLGVIIDSFVENFVSLMLNLLSFKSIEFENLSISGDSCRYGIVID